MKKKVQIALIDTYIPDNRFSMYLFAKCLLRELPLNTRMSPFLVSPNQNRCSIYIKILRKFLLFPIKIAMASRDADIVHFCDTSHAVFLNFLPIQAVVTVHDLGGIRNIKGSKSLFYRLWQSLIARGLRKSQKIICASTQSLAEVNKYIAVPADRVALILNSTFQRFPHLSDADAFSLISKLEQSVSGRKFILHIGSNEPRKNRRGVVLTLSELRRYGDYHLVLAGYAPDPELGQYIDALGLANYVVTIETPTVEILAALYKTAEALVFPSYYEGFGIPVAEAQINGCPVVCSNIPPHLEILNGTGFVAEPDNAPQMARFVVGLSEKAMRDQVIEDGEKNGKKYIVERMVNDYIDLYEDIVDNQHG